MSTPHAMPACGVGGARPWSRREAGCLCVHIEVAVCTEVFFPSFNKILLKGEQAGS